MLAAPTIAPADTTPSLLPAGKPLALLAYLHRQGPSAHREQLLDLLWSEVEPERARHSLRQALTTLRRVLGSDAIRSEGEIVRLCAPVGSDVADLTAALTRGDLAGAVALGAQRFLEHFALPGAEGFERWADQERRALDAALNRARETLVRAALADGQYATARVQARALCAGDPEQATARRLLLEVLLASGDRAAALLEADALEAWAQAEHRELEPATQRLLRRARGAPAPPNDRPLASSSGRADVSPWGAPDLVGRAAEFAAVLQAWRRVPTAGLVRVHVTGRAGIGKTRLLTDVTRRLAAEGARVAEVRCSPGAQGIAGGTLADVVATLAALPGALGVPPACTGDLVELAPVVTATYRAAAAGPPAGALPAAERDRRRVVALQLLLAAVSEERPCVLVLDDVHWADAYSAPLLLAVLARARTARVLVLSTARPALAPAWSPVHGGSDGEGPSAAASDVSLDLAPLAPGEVEALVRSMGQLPSETAWVPAILGALHAASEGVPFAVLDLLSRLHERALLVLQDDRWVASNPDALLDAIHLGSGPRLRIASLDRATRTCLRWLAVAGVPLPESGVAAGELSPEAVGTALLELGRRDLAQLVPAARAGGVATPGARAWECAHDEIRDAVLADLDATTQRGIAAALGELWLRASQRDDRRAEAGPSSVALRHAARAFLDGGAEERLVVVFERWCAEAHARRDRRPDAVLARDLLGEAATSARVRRLLASRPWTAQMRAAWQDAMRSRVPVGATVAVTVVAMLAVGRIGESAGARAPSVPTTLRLVTPPEGWFPGLPMTPVPMVEVLDGQGRPVIEARDSMRLHVAQHGAVVGGQSVVPVQSGRATFERATLARPGEGPLRAVFTYPGVPPLVVDVPRDHRDMRQSTLRLDGGRVNGQEVGATRRTVTVAPGVTLVVELDLRYTSPWPAANVVLGATPTWGAPDTAFVRLASLVTPGVDYAVHTRFTTVAPRTPGTYHVIAAMGAEENVAYLLSGTNWSVGRPIWGDGNDVARWSLGQIAEANAVGSAPTTLLERRDGPPATGVARPEASSALAWRAQRTAATAVTIRIEAPGGSAPPGSPRAVGR